MLQPKEHTETRFVVHMFWENTSEEEISLLNSTIFMLAARKGEETISTQFGQSVDKEAHVNESRKHVINKETRDSKQKTNIGQQK